ncbi:hypothetical protein BV20DRAFT_945102, partial [Pilatotrama ljubarskyi]
ILQCLLDTIYEVREFINASRPLLRLPAEILCQIMSHIPAAAHESQCHYDRSAWRQDLRDTAMIVPISQSCRRLRRVALDNPSLWTSITADGRPCQGVFTERSRGLPLHVYMPSQFEGTSRGVTLDSVTSDILARAQNLLVGIEPPFGAAAIIESLSSGPLPMLESLSLMFNVDKRVVDESAVHTPLPYVTKESVPRLTRIHLKSYSLVPTNILSSLTHLALSRLWLPSIHKKLEEILSVCYCLESLDLEGVGDNREQGQYHGFEYHLETPSALPACRRLRRAVMKYMHGTLASYCISLILSKPPQLALQILRTRSLTLPVIPVELFHNAAKVSIGRYSGLRSNPFIWGLTTSSPQCTLRMTCPEPTPVPHDWGDLLHADLEPVLKHPALRDAEFRELWLVDASPSEDGNACPVEPDAHCIRSATIAMHALETVVLAEESQAKWAHAAPPSLRLLPDGRDPAFSAPRLNTLRIVHGYLWSLENTSHVAEDNDWLDLSVVLDDMASGAYDYLKHISIEVPYHVQLDQAHLKALAESFTSVQVTVAEQAPVMELPEYCFEPYAWPDPQPWPLSRW